MDRTRCYNMDCLPKMKEFPDKWFDLAIVDPPYGIKENGNRDIRPKGAATIRKKYNDSLWDCDAPNSEYFNELRRVSKNQIIWGGNYFDMPASRCWIVWDKRGDCPGNDFADAELAYTSFNTSVRKFTYLWNGMLQENMRNKEERIHPTQKPVALYKWLLKNYAKEGDKILDSHAGSQSSRIAAFDMGFEYVGYELDESYFIAGNERFENHKKQLKIDFNDNSERKKEVGNLPNLFL